MLIFFHNKSQYFEGFVVLFSIHILAQRKRETEGKHAKMVVRTCFQLCLTHDFYICLAGGLLLLSRNWPKVKFTIGFKTVMPRRYFLIYRYVFVVDNTLHSEADGSACFSISSCQASEL